MHSDARVEGLRGRRRFALTLGGGFVAVVGTVVGLARWDASPAPTPAPPAVGVHRDPARELARERLRALVQASRALMPSGYSNVYVGITVQDLRSARPTVVRGRSTSDGRSDVWEESLPDGTHVIYLVAPDLGVVTQVQFMARLANGDALLTDFRTRRERYGDPTGFWDCPETPESSPIRRITWSGDAASVMEAILLTPTAVSVTLVVGATEDIHHALLHGHCQAVTADGLSHWPVATDLRGEEAPFAHPR